MRYDSVNHWSVGTGSSSAIVPSRSATPGSELNLLSLQEPARGTPRAGFQLARRYVRPVEQMPNGPLTPLSAWVCSMRGKSQGVSGENGLGPLAIHW
jgi:hypothetical protein